MDPSTVKPIMVNIKAILNLELAVSIIPTLHQKQDNKHCEAAQPMQLGCMEAKTGTPDCPALAS